MYVFEDLVKKEYEENIFVHIGAKKSQWHTYNEGILQVPRVGGGGGGGQKLTSPVCPEKKKAGDLWGAWGLLPHLGKPLDKSIITIYTITLFDTIQQKVGLGILVIAEVMKVVITVH